MSYTLGQNSEKLVKALSAFFSPVLSFDNVIKVWWVN